MTRSEEIDRSLLGVGLYTLAEAERLSLVPRQRIRRWLSGYEFKHKGRLSRSEPLWQPQLPRIEGRLELGFRDLLELKFVDAFEKAGVSLYSIRRVLTIARDVLGDAHPFSTSRFRTDGRTLFLQVSNETGEPTLIDLAKGQYAFNRLVEPSFKDLDIEDGVAARWWPLSHKKSVVVDPERNFGHPIIAEFGIPTVALADAVRAEGSVGQVAKVFELPIKHVRHAVDFETRFAA